MSSELQVTLSPEVAAIVVKEAARTGSTADAVANEAIRERLVTPKETATNGSGGEHAGQSHKTLYDRFAKHLSVIESLSPSPGAPADASVNTGQKYADSLLEEYQRKQSR